MTRKGREPILPAHYRLDIIPARGKIQNVNYKPVPPDDAQPIPLEQRLQLLQVIDQNPQTTQAHLAAHLGVAVGTVNWYLKRMIAKGYIKIRRMQRRRLLYLITPRGLAEKSRLGVQYAQASLGLYRETRERALAFLVQVRRAGFDRVVIEGGGDLAEICRLTCLEQNVDVAKTGGGRGLPVLHVDGTQINLSLPEPAVAGRAKSPRRGL